MTLALLQNSFHPYAPPFTVAGTLGSPGSRGDGGPATSAKLDNPYDVAVDSLGNIYIADAQNHAIRKMEAPLGGGSTSVSAIPSDVSAVVSWTAPTSDGDSPITGYAAWRLDISHRSLVRYLKKGVSPRDS